MLLYIPHYDVFTLLATSSDTVTLWVKKKAAEYSTNCSYKHPGPLPSQLSSAHGSDKDVFLRPPDRDVAAFVPREPTAGGHSFVSMLIITNHLPGGEVWHIFVTVVTRAITDYHQDIKLTRQYE